MEEKNNFSEMGENNKESFDYCKFVDVHATNDNDNLGSVVAIAEEHGFRGILVNSVRSSGLVKEVRKNTPKEGSIIPISLVDFPNGDSSSEIRNFAIKSSADAGIQEIEISAPNFLITQKNFSEINKDIISIAKIAKQYKMTVKYIFNDHYTLTPQDRSKILKIIGQSGLDFISVGYMINKINHSDKVLQIRGIKGQTNMNIKTFVGTKDPSDLISFSKAGVDIVGIDWRDAAYMAHSYEESVEN